MKLEEGELVSDGIGVRAAMEEAMEAVKPFEMVFDGVEWFTIYVSFLSVGGELGGRCGQLIWVV